MSHPSRRSILEVTLEWQLKAAKLWPGAVAEFCNERTFGRKFRFDFAFPAHVLLVECEGATWVPNRGHTSGAGIQRDIDKLNAATLAGWRVLRFTKAMIDDGTALRQIEEFLKR
jgi:very-short-patch-repair endonuclease